MNKKILITARVERIEKYEETRDVLDQDLSAFVEGLGFIPVLMPNVLTRLPEYLDQIKPDGIILSGGNDIHPDLYGGGKDMASNISEARDRTEMEVVRYAVERDIPLLGICRGMQLINVFFGGRLVQDLTKVAVGTIGHVVQCHPISFNEEMFFEEYRNKTMTVNSYHDQGITEEVLAEKLTPLASTADGLIEALTLKGKKVFGIMWHPERQGNDRESDIVLIRKFFNQS